MVIRKLINIDIKSWLSGSVSRGRQIYLYEVEKQSYRIRRKLFVTCVTTLFRHYFTSSHYSIFASAFAVLTCALDFIQERRTFSNFSNNDSLPPLSALIRVLAGLSCRNSHYIVTYKCVLEELHGRAVPGSLSAVDNARLREACKVGLSNTAT